MEMDQREYQEVTNSLCVINMSPGSTKIDENQVDEKQKSYLVI